MMKKYNGPQLRDTIQSRLLEAFANQAHKSWLRWMEYLFSKSIENEDGTVTIPAELVERWKRQISTHYGELTTKEQESDRKEAHYYIDIIFVDLVERGNFW